jgi:hypothetical protein
MSGGGEIEVPHDEHDPFTKRVALSVAIFAVILAVAGLGGKNAGKDMLSEQINASNRWAQYQAKSVREAIYRNDAEKMEFERAKGGITPDAAAQLDKSIARVRGKLEEYEKEKAEIKAIAEGHQEAEKTAQRKDGYFDYAELLLQIAIVSASVSLLSKSRGLWIASIFIVLLALVLTVNGYTLAFHIGFIEGH